MTIREMVKEPRGGGPKLPEPNVPQRVLVPAPEGDPTSSRRSGACGGRWRFYLWGGASVRPQGPAYALTTGTSGIRRARISRTRLEPIPWACALPRPNYQESIIGGFLLNDGAGREGILRLLKTTQRDPAFSAPEPALRQPSC